MKRFYRTIVLMIVLTFTIMPLPAFAADGTVWPNAVYTITDKTGKSVKLQYDYLDKKIVNFPQQGDVVKIFKDGDTSKAADETYVYNGKTFDDGNSGHELEYKVSGSNFASAAIDLRIYRQIRSYVLNDNLQFDITKNEAVSPVRAPLKSFTYSPSKIRLYSEDIKVRAVDGEYLYKFALRTRKTPDGHNMQSECAVGDKAIVTYTDGTAETYDSQFTSSNGGYGFQFVNSKGQTLRVRAKEDEIALVRGDNTVRMYIRNNPEITTSINVFVWTPDMGAYPGDYAEEQSSPKDEKKKATAEKAEQKTVKPVSITKIKGVKAGRTGKRLKVTWKGLTKTQKANVNKIQIQYSNNKHFRNATKVWVKNSQKKYVTKKLKKGKYYVRVRSMRKVQEKKYYSKWSAVKGVKIR